MLYRFHIASLSVYKDINYGASVHTCILLNLPNPYGDRKILQNSTVLHDW